MNDKYYEDEPVFKLRPTHIKKQRKPPFVKEFEYFSPKLLNKQPTPSDREGYYIYYYMENYYTSHTEKKGNKSVKVYKKHVSKKSVEVTLEQWNTLHEGDCEDYRDNRREYEKLEYEPKMNDRYVSTLDVMLQQWDKFEHEQFWVNAFDLERVLNTFSDEDLDIYLYAKEKHLKQKQIALLIGKSESYVTRRTKYIEDYIEYDMLDNGERTKTEITALLEYNKFIRTGKTDSFADVFVYDFLLQMPQSIQLKYLFIFRGQEHLIKFCFLWLFNYLTAKEKPVLKAVECLSKHSFQLYKKYVIKLKARSRQLFIALEMEVERLVKRYGIRDSKPDEKFIKTVQKAATARGMTVAEYRDKILFPHGKERIIARFKQFLKQHPEAEGKPKSSPKNNTSTMAMKKFINKNKY